MSVKQVVEQRSSPVERPVQADLCPEFEGDRIDMWTNIPAGALHGSFASALFGTAVPCGNGLSRFAGFPHQAIIQPRIKTGFVVGIGPGGLAKTSPQILETVANHLGNVPESGKVLFFGANVERSRFATCGGTPDIIQSELAELNELRDRFEGTSFLESPGDVELDSIQKKGIWNHPDLDRARSRLFAAALQLHESWLAESMNKHGFKANIFAINKLLSNQRLENREQSLLIWQSLFMIVPVISTTFASLARQFCDLESDSIGWLFVDEAGQAVPQAAVGGLWRAKRVIVVGDPLQIEPVFTLPSRLIAALSDQASFADKEDYAPNKSSAQYLADRANRFGAALPRDAGDSLWIGSPLRVHRRCIYPMYPVANRIAYQNKMIFGLKEREQPNGPPIHCDSSWIDISGKVLRKQEVPEQTRFVVDLLTHLFKSSEDPLGIYVISPFREVKNAIKNELISAVGAKAPMEKKSAVKLKKWCDKRIGTVHTFQGKEEDTVLLVLGADREHSGAAQWAASKPNLLNVAITRAKRRFYVIGERSLWESLPYFEAAAQELKIRTPDEILRSLKVVSPASILSDEYALFRRSSDE